MNNRPYPDGIAFYGAWDQRQRADNAEAEVGRVRGQRDFWAEKAVLKGNLLDTLHAGIARLERAYLEGGKIKRQGGEWVLFDFRGECNDDMYAKKLLHLIQKMGEGK